jgi:hypothetical protein
MMLMGRSSVRLRDPWSVSELPPWVLRRQSPEIRLMIRKKSKRRECVEAHAGRYPHEVMNDLGHRRLESNRISPAAKQ